MDRITSTSGIVEPLFGRLSSAQVQLCPQSRGILSEERAASLRSAYPDTKMRLHANVRVASGQPRYRTCDVHEGSKAYFAELGRISRALGASIYTLHAGRRRDGSLVSLHTELAVLEDWMGVAVGVEAMCEKRDLLSSWKELRWLLDNGVKYALDLSHVQIIAKREGKEEHGLLKDLLESPGCIEIHVSDNDGRRDRHQLLNTQPWWWQDLLDAAAQITAVVFSEGNQRRR